MSYLLANTRSHQAAHQQGVGMIEVLITLFILSVGLLGVASLQFVGSFSNTDALNRSQAVLVAQQFSERLRASARLSQSADGLIVDNQYFDTGNYNFDGMSCSGSSPYKCHCETIPSAIPDCQANQCNSAEIAQYDAYTMSCSAVQNNPTMEVSLACADTDAADGDSCSVGSRHTIMLAWPVANWQNLERTLNANCNTSRTEPYDCIILEVTL